MAFSRKQQRSSRRGNGVGHNAPPLEYHMTYSQNNLDVSYNSGSFAGQQGLTEGPTVNPQDLYLNRGAPGSTGLPQDFGDSIPSDPGYAASVFPQSSGTDLDYLNSTHSDLSGDGLGTSA